MKIKEKINNSKFRKCLETPKFIWFASSNKRYYYDIYYKYKNTRLVDNVFQKLIKEQYKLLILVSKNDFQKMLELGLLDQKDKQWTVTSRKKPAYRKKRYVDRDVWSAYQGLKNS